MTPPKATIIDDQLYHDHETIDQETKKITEHWYKELTNPPKFFTTWDRKDLNTVPEF